MEQFDREDSSTYTDSQPQSQPYQPISEQPAQPPVEQAPKPKKSRAALVLSLLLILAVVGAATLGWMWYEQNGRVDNLEADLSSARNNVTRLESAAKADAALTDTDSTLETDTNNSDSEAIIEAGLAYANADITMKDVKATLNKQVGDFAQVNITSGDISYGEILKKSGDQWVVVWASEVGISDDAIAKYAIPKEFTGRN